MEKTIKRRGVNVSRLGGISHHPIQRVLVLCKTKCVAAIGICVSPTVHYKVFTWIRVILLSSTEVRLTSGCQLWWCWSGNIMTPSFHRAFQTHHSTCSSELTISSQDRKLWRHGEENPSRRIVDGNYKGWFTRLCLLATEFLRSLTTRECTGTLAPSMRWPRNCLSPGQRFCSISNIHTIFEKWLFITSSKTF